MRAITLTQPWASLLAIGAKRIETRSWRTNYRGRLLIHAAARWPASARALVDVEPYASVLGGLTAKDLPRGAVIADCTLVDVVPITTGPAIGQRTVALDEDGIARVWSPTTLFGHNGLVGEEANEHEAVFGDYTPGRWAWLLDDVRPLDEPVRATGSLGLWTPSPTLLATLTALAEAR